MFSVVIPSPKQERKSNEMKSEQFSAIARQYREAEKAIMKKYVIEQTFLRLLGDVKGKKAIDLACGSGYFTRLVRKFGAKTVIGLDSSSEQIKLAEEMEGNEKLGIEYTLGDVTDFNCKQWRGFDIVTTVFLLNYASAKKQLWKFCSHIFDSLKSGV